MTKKDFGISKVVALEGDDQFGSIEGGVGIGGKCLCAGGRYFPENRFMVIPNTEKVKWFAGLIDEITIVRTQPA